MQASLERLRQRRSDRGEEGGFTLIELLIVIVILGILAAIVVFAVQNLTKESSQASCGSDYKTVETATEVFKSQIGYYPGDAAIPAGTVTPGTGSADAGINTLLGTGTVGGNTVGPWLKDDPKNVGHYSITVSVDGKGTITVHNSAGGAVAGCSAITG
jgi:prepilin-type N-terminal cleavage/methylation domain-containing protein